MDENSTTFTMRLPKPLKEAFDAACKSNDRSAAQMVRDFMREYVQKNNQAGLFDKRGKK